MLRRTPFISSTIGEDDMVSLADRESFDLDRLVRRASAASTTREYGADLRRLLPQPALIDTRRDLTEFGAILVTVRPREKVVEHRHDEEECFIVTSGAGELTLEGKTTVLDVGDVAYIPRYWTHQLTNPNPDVFQFVDLYWDDRGRSFEDYEESQDGVAL